MMIIHAASTSELHEIESRMEGPVPPVMPSEWWLQFGENTVRYFMWKHGVYVLPVTELADYFRSLGTEGMVEIGAGNGALARVLGVPATDLKAQLIPEVASYYAITGQPAIVYPAHVEKLEALEAVRKYGASTVIGCYITHRYDGRTRTGFPYGPNEEAILAAVQRYVLVGNSRTHKDKPINRIPHKREHFPWLITRAPDPENNCIFTWIGKGKGA